MKVFYTEPSDDTNYKIWFDHIGIHDIWYENSTKIVDYENMNIPEELQKLLNKWKKKFSKYEKAYLISHKIKDNAIEFIYNDYVYSIYGDTFENNDISLYNTMLDHFQMQIRDDLKKTLGVIYTRYWGSFDKE